MASFILRGLCVFGSIQHAAAGKGGLRKGAAPNRTLSSSSDPDICDAPDYQNSCAENKCYCDGGQDLSCSPFQYRPLKYNDDNGLSMYWSEDGYHAFGKCDDVGDPDDVYITTMTGFQDGGGASAWADQSKGHPSEYFVFHGCDGAGLQPDCAGDIKFIERFGGYYNGDGEGFDAMPGTGICGIPGDSTDGRNFCKYVRPGSHKIYDDYQGGWWCDGTIDAGCVTSQATQSDYSAFPWLHDVVQSAEGGLPYDWFNGEHPFAKDGASSGVGQGKEGLRFSFMLFPWRCAESDMGDHRLLSYPSITDPGYKCWVDNEPGDIGYPYSTEVYFGLLTQEAEGDVIYMLKYATTPDQEVISVAGDTNDPIKLTRYSDYWY